MLRIKKTLLIRLISLLLSTSVALPGFAYSLPENHSDTLRVPLNTPELRERQKEAIEAVAMAFPIDAHLEAEEMAVGGVTYMGDGGKEVIHIFNPAPVFDFTLAKKIKDRYLENTHLSDSEGMLAASVYRVKQLLGEEESESPKTIQELIEMADKGNISALVALELKGALFSIHNLRPGWTFAGWGEAKKAIYERFTSNSERKEALKLVRKLAIRLADKGIGLKYALEYAIPAIADAATNIEELKLFINLAIRLADKGINPGYTLQSAIPAATKLAKTPQELKDICNILFYLGIKLAANKKVRDFITAEHIEKALEVQRKYGDFRVAYIPATTDAVYLEIADRIVKESSLDSKSIEVVIKDLKSGRRIFQNKYHYPGNVRQDEEIYYDVEIDVRKGIKTVRKESRWWENGPFEYGGWGVSENEINVYWDIPTIDDDQPKNYEIQILPPDSTSINQAEIRSRGLRDQV